MTHRGSATLGSVVLLLTLLAGPPETLGAQARRGAFVITHDGRTVGAEHYDSRPDGDRVRTTSTVSYLVTPLLGLELDLAYGPTEQAFQVERRQGSASAKVYAVQQRGRVTVRQVAPGGEKASEFPGDPDLVLLADSAFAPLLRLIPLAAGGPRPVKALYPASGRRVTIRLERQTGPGGTLILMRGGLTGEIALGPEGRVRRITLPDLGLEARDDPQ